MPRTKLQKHVEETIFKEDQKVLIVSGTPCNYEGRVVYSPHRPKRYDVHIDKLNQIWVDFQPYQLKKI